jgi:ABC-type antimicrobial peptide transport system permease subunit
MSAAAASVFAVLALLLAAIGLYGVVSYAVSRRTREVGIRMSLGAVPGGVVRMLMGEGLRLVVAGAIAGLVLSALFALLLSRFLYGVTAFDPRAFGGTAAVLLAVAMLASWLPARRATRVSVVTALRSE